MKRKKIIFENGDRIHTVDIFAKCCFVSNPNYHNDIWYGWDVTMDTPISFEYDRDSGKPLFFYLETEDESSIIDYMLKVKRANYYYTHGQKGKAFDLMQDIHDAADTIIYQFLSEDAECEFF